MAHLLPGMSFILSVVKYLDNLYIQKNIKIIWCNFLEVPRSLELLLVTFEITNILSYNIVF